jgi:hypothetical protein
MGIKTIESLRSCLTKEELRKVNVIKEGKEEVKKPNCWAQRLLMKIVKKIL